MKQIASIILVLLLIVSCNETERDFSSLAIKEDFSISIDMFDQTGKDLDFTFTWKGPAPQVFWTGLNTYYPLEAQSEKSNLNVKISKKLTTRAGVFNIKALKNDTLYQLGKVHLSSGPSSGKIPTFIGPKSIINDGNQESEIIAFPLDSFRNPTGQNSSVELNIIDDGKEKHEILKLADDFVTKKFTSVQGKTLIAGINSSQAFSETNQIRTLSLCPVNIMLFTEGTSYIADGQQFFKAWTNVLTDDNGQQISEGTIAKFRVLADNLEIAEYQAYTVNGVVSCWIKNPSKEGKYNLEVQICDQRKLIPLGQFSGLVTNFEYKWKDDYIEIGPVTNELGQFIPDGSPVSITIEKDSIVQTIEKHLVDGHVLFGFDEFWIRDLPKNGIVEINDIFYKIRSSGI